MPSKQPSQKPTARPTVRSFIGQKTWPFFSFDPCHLTIPCVFISLFPVTANFSSNCKIMRLSLDLIDDKLRLFLDTASSSYFPYSFSVTTNYSDTFKESNCPTFQRSYKRALNEAIIQCKQGSSWISLFLLLVCKSNPCQLSRLAYKCTYHLRTIYYQCKLFMPPISFLCNHCLFSLTFLSFSFCFYAYQPTTVSQSQILAFFIELWNEPQPNFSCPYFFTINRQIQRMNQLKNPRLNLLLQSRLHTSLQWVLLLKSITTLYSCWMVYSYDELLWTCTFSLPLLWLEGFQPHHALQKVILLLQIRQNHQATLLWVFWSSGLVFFHLHFIFSCFALFLNVNTSDTTANTEGSTSSRN